MGEKEELAPNTEEQKISVLETSTTTNSSNVKEDTCMIENTLVTGINNEFSNLEEKTCLTENTVTEAPNSDHIQEIKTSGDHTHPVSEEKVELCLGQTVEQVPVLEEMKIPDSSDGKDSKVEETVINNTNVEQTV